MKPGMQRDILVAYWLLFDEFAADDDPPTRPSEPHQPAPANSTNSVAKPQTSLKNGKS